MDACLYLLQTHGVFCTAIVSTSKSLPYYRCCYNLGRQSQSNSCHLHSIVLIKRSLKCDCNECLMTHVYSLTMGHSCVCSLHLPNYSKKYNIPIVFFRVTLMLLQLKKAESRGFFSLSPLQNFTQVCRYFTPLT